MKLIKKVTVLEVKRAFIVPQMIRKHKEKNGTITLKDLRSNKRILEELSYKEFEIRLKNSKKFVLKLKENELDTIIANEWKKRLIAYNDSDWYLGEVNVNEVGVWSRAAGLPLLWTDGSLKQTAKRVEDGLSKNSKLISRRAKKAITNILRTNTHKLQNEKYLFPIIFKGGTGTKGRKKLKKKMKGDIDDGCIRSIAIAISGVKTIKSYIGIPKKVKSS